MVCAGCLKFRNHTWKPLTLHKVAVGAATCVDVFQAEAVRIKQVWPTKVEADVIKPRLNLLADSDGLLHVIALLQVTLTFPPLAFLCAFQVDEFLQVVWATLHK